MSAQSAIGFCTLFRPVRNRTGTLVRSVPQQNLVLYGRSVRNRIWRTGQVSPQQDLAHSGQVSPNQDLALWLGQSPTGFGALWTGQSKPGFGTLVGSVRNRISHSGQASPHQNLAFFGQSAIGFGTPAGQSSTGSCAFWSGQSAT
jgi:hypothetical protein